MEVAFYVPSHRHSPRQIFLDVRADTSCSEALEMLLQWMEVPGRERGAWHLAERWRNCERVIAPEELIVPLYKSWRKGDHGSGKIYLRNHQEGKKRRKKVRPRHRWYYKPAPRAALVGRLSYKKLLAVHQGLRRIALKHRRQYRSILLSRLAKHQPLWGPRQPTIVEVASHKLGIVQEQNLALSTEIADLNISSTRLASQLAPLQDQGRALTERLAALQAEVMKKRELRERKFSRSTADTQAEILKLKRELDLRNRLNAVQNTKMQSQKKTLADKRKVLSEKKQELSVLMSTLEEKKSLPTTTTAPSERAKVGGAKKEVPESGTATERKERKERRETELLERWRDVDSQVQYNNPSKREALEQSRSQDSQQTILLHSPQRGPQQELGPAPAASSGPDSCTPTHGQGTPLLKPRTPSTSKKRHSSVFEAKTRQLVEEEGLVFKKYSPSLAPSERPKLREGQGDQSQAVKRLNFSNLGTDSVDSGTMFPSESEHEELPPTDPPPPIPADSADQDPTAILITAPQPDRQWYESQESPDLSYRQKIEQQLGSHETVANNHESEVAKRLVRDEGKERGRKTSTTENLLDEVMSSLEQLKMKGGSEAGDRGGKHRNGRRVTFAPEAIILNAAMEGELETLKQCVQELGTCSVTSDKGATCLHNAVCSGSLETVCYLIEMGCDVNAQDVDGWTPLHCAVAYSNPDMIHYLVSNGASLFMQTTEGESPLQIGIEEFQCQQEGGETSPTLEKCIKYLTDTYNSLGKANNGTTFALFSQRSSDPEELSFHEGEQLDVIRRGEEKEGSGDWWLVKNAQGRKGYVPCTLLGLHRRHSVIL